MSVFCATEPLPFVLVGEQPVQVTFGAGDARLVLKALHRLQIDNIRAHLVGDSTAAELAARNDAIEVIARQIGTTCSPTTA